MTSDQVLQTSRAAQFLEFSFDYKDVWIYHARKQFAGSSLADKIERYAREWKLSGDPKKAKRHWSELRGFTWSAQELVHPLDPLTFGEADKEKEYAVDYFQACQWVHCSQPALDNYVLEEGAPFKFSKSSGEFGNPAHTVLYVLLKHLHLVMKYALYGLRIAVPQAVDSAYSNTLASMTPIGKGVSP